MDGAGNRLTILKYSSMRIQVFVNGALTGTYHSDREALRALEGIRKGQTLWKELDALRTKERRIPRHFRTGAQRERQAQLSKEIAGIIEIRNLNPIKVEIRTIK